MKKKLYLYLALLGVGLMLGSITAFINKSIGTSLAADSEISEITNCMSSGGVWLDGFCKCDEGYLADSLGYCRTSCAGYETSTTQSSCNSCAANGGIWNFSSHKCEKGGSTTIDSCDDYSQTGTQSNCNNCESSGGTWSYDSLTCSCSGNDTLNSSGYCIEGGCSTNDDCDSDNGYSCVLGVCTQITTCPDGYIASGGICTPSCSGYSSSVTQSLCNSCINNGGTWNYSSNTCDTSSGTSCRVYGSSNDIGDKCVSCTGSNGNWNFKDNSCTCNRVGFEPNSSGVCEITCNIYDSSNTVNKCNICGSSGGSWDYESHACLCDEGYELNSSGVCEKKSSGSGSSESGYYYINSEGKCTEYPSLPGYCIEPGVLYYSSATYAPCERSLSCTEIAAGYYGNSGGSAQFSAQGLLNGRDYYTDSDCGSILPTTGSSVNTQAEKWCNLKPSFSGNSVALKVGESITLTDTNGVLSDYNVSSSSSAISVSKNGNSLTIVANSNVNGATITFSKGSKNSYQAYCSTNMRSQTYANISALPYVSDSMSVYTTTDLVEDTYGGFKIVKTNDSGNRLSGVKFKVGSNLFGTEGSIDTGFVYMTTDSNGEIALNNIKTGTNIYYQEVETIDGYILDSKVYNLTIAKNTIKEINLINSREEKAMFKIFKTNESGIPLEGVKFKVGTNLNGTEGIDWSYMVTNASGYITIGDIDINTKYYYQEIETLDGYHFDGEVKEIIIDNVNKVFVATVINYSTTSLKIIKKDADNGNIIRNVEFNIYNSNDEVVYTEKTDAEGKIIIRDIPNGKYYVKEIKAPDGYLLNDKKYEFEISDSNKNVELVITNKPDNPSTGVYGIFTTFILGAVCLIISLYQYKKLKNVEFM